MEFLTILLYLFALCGPALGGPVGERGALEERTAWMFKYCEEANLGGRCTSDLDNNLNVCEKVGMANLAASTKVYGNFKCTLYRDYNCGGATLDQGPGEHKQLPNGWPKNFRSYKCRR